MATWIMHLRVAESSLGTIDGLNRCQFLIGNLAPDSGVPDEKWERVEPPAEVTHFGRGVPAGRPSEDLEFYRKYLSTPNGPGKDSEKYSFLLGYFFHLVLDNLWDYHVGWPTVREYTTAQFDKNPQLIREIKRDWFDLDFLYLKEHPDCIFWNLFQKCECDEQYLDFLPLEAIRKRIHGIRSFYQNKDELKRRAKRRPFIYLSEETANKFVERFSRRMRDIYDHLNKHVGDVSSCYSTLELQPERTG